MLPTAALDAADRLIETLLTLLEAVAGVVIAAIHAPASSPSTGSDQAATAFYFRLQSFIVAVIRISAFGISPPRHPRLPIAPVTPPDRPARDPQPGIPRRPGWLLAVLPDIAPAIAADLVLILADPAVATLLEAAPTLQRTLAPLLRALGLTDALRSPPPKPAPPTSSRAGARTALKSTAPPAQTQPLQPRAKNRSAEPPNLHAQVITLS